MVNDINRISKTRPYRCWTEFDLVSLERNLGKIRAALQPTMRFVAVVKADAYGHGLSQTVTRLMQTGVDAFAVANLEEATQVQEIGTGWPILILSAILPEEDYALQEISCIPAVSCVEEVQRFAKVARTCQRSQQIHMKIDTGMGRLGVWHTEAIRLYKSIKDFPELILSGIFTHFSSPVTDPSFTEHQRDLFLKTVRGLNANRSNWLIHADNSASLRALVRAPEYNLFNAVRIGLLQFGAKPAPHSFLSDLETEAVLSFHTKVGLVKHLPAGTPISYQQTYRLQKAEKIAILTAGYGDGIPTQLSNRGSVLIRGKRCPILGRVTMDQVVVSAREIPDLQCGETVTLIGKQVKEEITVQEFSEKAGVIPWEVFCSITQRVKRLYRTIRA